MEIISKIFSTLGYILNGLLTLGLWLINNLVVLVVLVVVLAIVFSLLRVVVGVLRVVLLVGIVFIVVALLWWLFQGGNIFKSNINNTGISDEVTFTL